MIKLAAIKIDPGLKKIIGITARQRVRSRIIAGKIQHPKGKTKETGKTLVLSRQLANQLNYKIQGDKILLGPSGPSKKYAKILHEGGIIRPRTAQFLAIPLTKAARVKSPRDFKDTFFAKGCIMLKTGKGPEDFIPIYALKKQVEIPAFNWLRIDTQDKKILVQRATEYLVGKYS